jgi:hypothetical protein
MEINSILLGRNSKSALSNGKQTVRRKERRKGWRKKGRRKEGKKEVRSRKGKEGEGWGGKGKVPPKPLTLKMNPFYPRSSSRLGYLPQQLALFLLLSCVNN